jgi:endoglycosylceramidase
MKLAVRLMRRDRRSRSAPASFLAVFIFTLSSCASTGPEWVDDLEAPILTSNRLTVDGTRLRDELGRQVILRGFNAGGRAKMPPFLPFDVPGGSTLDEAADDFFRRLAALGANTIRLTFSWEAFEPVHGDYDMDYLADYTAMLDAAHDHGLFVIVDFHQDVFASPFCGDGFPLWAIGDIPHGEPRYDCSFPSWSFPAFDPESAVSQAFDRLWNDTDGLAGDMEAMWRMLASVVSSHPAVAAFEVINEPAKGSHSQEVFDSTVLPAFYERMGGAIREAAGDFPVLWDERIGAMSNPEHLEPPNLEGAVYAPHFYEPSIAIGFETVEKETITEAMATAFGEGQLWNMPVIVGEFGVPNGNAAKADYLDFFLDQIDIHQGHATMWDAQMSPEFWNGEDFSILLPDGSEHSWAGAMVRAYPRAIAGRIVSFSWDAERARFELEVAEATPEVSEIHLPSRYLGAAPRIRIDGAVRARFDADRELLLISAQPGTRYSVTAEP